MAASRHKGGRLRPGQAVNGLHGHGGQFVALPQGDDGLGHGGILRAVQFQTEVAVVAKGGAEMGHILGGGNRLPGVQVTDQPAAAAAVQGQQTVGLAGQLGWGNP